MDPSNPEILRADVLLSLMLLLGVLASGAVWLVVGVRVMLHLPVVRYEARRPVPWVAIDLLVLLSLYVAASMLVAGVAREYSPMGNGRPAATGEVASPDTQHPLGRLLLGENGGWVLALCVFAAVLVAPLVEEFLFRLVFQGWLEAVERGGHLPLLAGLLVVVPIRLVPVLLRIAGRPRAIPPETAEAAESDNPYASSAVDAAPRGFSYPRRSRSRKLPIGVLPVFFSSLFFAALHFRTPEAEPAFNELMLKLVVMTVSSMLVFAVAVGYLRFRAGATLKDFGVVPGKILSDVRLGLVAYVAVCPAVYMLMYFAKRVAPSDWVVDPFPLFFFALALGFLYYRTHRIIPSIVVHAAFNATTVALVCLSKGG